MIPWHEWAQQSKWHNKILQTYRIWAQGPFRSPFEAERGTWLAGVATDGSWSLLCFISVLVASRAGRRCIPGDQRRMISAIVIAVKRYGAAWGKVPGTACASHT